MYEDDPQDKVFDVLGEAVFGDHPLGRADHRPRRRSIRDTPVDAIARLPRARATCRGNVVIAAAGSVDHDALVRCSRAGAARRAGAPAARPAPRRRRERRARALPAQGHRAVPRLPRRPRARRATTTAASRCACSTRSSAARRRRGCSRRCARSAGWPTPSTRSPASTPTPARSALYVGTRPDNLAEAMRGRRPPSSSACARSPPTEEELERAQGERQGAHRARRWSPRRAHEPPRRLAADRPAAARRSTRSWSASTP